MEKYTPFLQAKPVWAKDLDKQMHITLGFYFEPGDFAGEALLRVATSGFYRVFVNGEFYFYGPARCAHGFYRVDEVPVTLSAGDHIAIEVVNYYMKSFDQLKQPGFLQTELVAGEQVLAASGTDTVSAFLLTERVRKLERYSYQRPMSEGYKLLSTHGAWRVGKKDLGAEKVHLVMTEEKTLVPRRIALNKFPVAKPSRLLSCGNFVIGDEGEKPYFPWTAKILNIEEENYDGFTLDELEWFLSREARQMHLADLQKVDAPYSGKTQLTDGRFEILTMPKEKTGFIRAHISCEKAGSLYFMVDETLRENGDVDPLSMSCCNMLRLDMEPGEYDFMAMNPLGFRYLKLAVKNGSFTVDDLDVVELICPQPITAEYEGDDPQLAAVFEAAKETFLQNSSDHYMDCPTRERAGWLCDSFFTGRVEYAFTGASVIERNFLENFLLPERFPRIPEGMFPMCYPSDHGSGVYIPNWAMWLVLELEEYYFDRGGDKDLVMAFKEKIYKLIRFFTEFENSDGLLEHLKSWIFIEWSMANKLVRDISFPSNMIYARMLEAAGRLYDDAALVEKSAKLKDVIRQRSFDGTFFVDNEVYKDGVPVSSGERTETCQYYAFFTGVATPETYPELWKKLVEEFGPDRAEKGLYPQIYPSNAFIGNYLRLILLQEQGLNEQVLSECKGYFYYMAQRTGTLWEYISDHASCNHGFASYAACLIQNAEK